MNVTNQKQERPIGKFRLLLWLRWTLLWRAYRRDRMQVAGTVIMLVFLLPVSIGLSIAGFIFVRYNPSLAPLATRAVFGLAYAMWITAPLVGFTLNDSYDPTRLFVFPVKLSTVFAANVTGGLFEIPTLLLLPVLLSTCAATVTTAPSALLDLLIVVLFMLQTLASAQALMLTLIGFLRSRRFRDVTIVLLPLLALCYYTLQQLAFRGINTGQIRDFTQIPIWNIIAWLPPGWAASGVQAAGDQNWAMAALLVLALVALCGIVTSAAAYVMRQLFLGDRGPRPSAAPASKPAVIPAQIVDAHSGTSEAKSLPLPLVLARKEAIYLARDPQYKAFAVNMLYMVAVFGFASFGVFRHRTMPQPSFNSYAYQNPDLGPLGDIFRAIHDYGFAVGGIYASIFVTVAIVFNMFGGEGAAISMLMLFPVPRRVILLGKNIAYGVVLGALLVLVMVGECLFTHVAQRIPLSVALGVISLPVILGAGNVMSVLFPSRMVVRGQRMGRQNQMTLGGSGAARGCGYSLIFLVGMFASFAAILPVVLAVMVPDAASLGFVWYVVALGLACIYSAAVYLGALEFSSHLLGVRETQIIEALTPKE